jgi:calcium/calmodulin-dependent protein kinase I
MADTEQQALKHVWLSGKTASDHNLLPEIRAYVAKARLKRGIELVKLANRIEALKMQEDEEDDVPGQADMPANAREAAGEAIAAHSADKALTTKESATGSGKGPGRLSRIAKGAIFREVVLAKVREMKEQEARAEFEKKATEGGAKKA